MRKQLFISLHSLLLLTLAVTADAAISSIADPINDVPNKRGGDAYEITKMLVDWKSGSEEINVKVYTAFASRGNDYSYGDLLISTKSDVNLFSNSKSDWNYAFHLDDRSEDPTASRPNKGWLIETNRGLKTAIKDNAGIYTSVQANHPVGGLSHSTETADGSWYKSPGDMFTGFVNFTFNISSLGDPSQLAFRWAMTCANDVIRGIAYRPGDTTQVPEPISLTLILSGLMGLGFMQRRRIKSDMNVVSALQ